MSDKHLSDDDLVARVFGLEPADGHIETCEPCSRRLDLFRQRHQMRRMEVEIPEEMFAAQRRAIYQRLIAGKPRRFRPVWAPVPVVALLLAIAMFTVFRPVPQRQSTDAISEDTALQDVFTAASGSPPAGLKPVKFLFEVQK